MKLSFKPTLSPQNRGRAGAAAVVIALTGTAGNEGFKTKAYLDSGHVPTICLGETRGVKMGDTKTIAECYTMFEGRLFEFDVGIRKCLTDKLVDAMPATREAEMIDLAYNIGIGAFCRSSIARNLKLVPVQGHQAVVAACGSMLKYSYIGPVFVQGLYNRRLRNQANCLKEAA